MGVKPEETRRHGQHEGALGKRGSRARAADASVPSLAAIREYPTRTPKEEVSHQHHNRYQATTIATRPTQKRATKSRQQSSNTQEQTPRHHKLRSTDMYIPVSARPTRTPAVSSAVPDPPFPPPELPHLRRNPHCCCYHCWSTASVQQQLALLRRPQGRRRPLSPTPC